MIKETLINFHNILLSISDAIDLSNSRLASHQIRTAYIAWKVSSIAKFDKEIIERIYIASLLHDIGALSLENKIKLVDSQEDDIETHAILGGVLFDSNAILKKSSGIVKFHHREWLNWDRSIAHNDVLESQIVLLADTIERLVNRKQYILHQHNDIKSKILSFSGNQIHPDIVDLFMNVTKQEEFWLDLSSPRLYSLLLQYGPVQGVYIDLETMISLSEIVRNIIDFKSPFTATHSTGVAECAAIMSDLFGFTKSEIAPIKLAGFFHDLGKLAIPNSILEKPGKLTDQEFAVIRQHPYFTYSVLSSIEGLEHIAKWAAFHHERLDGTGYPFHLDESQICTQARIMAVSDIFTALSEDRPYRPGMEKQEIKKYLIEYANKNYIDKKLVGLLLDNFNNILIQVKEKQDTMQTYFDQKIKNLL